MQRKRSRPPEAGDAHTAVQVIGSIRREVLLVICVIESGPFFLFFVPPDQLLALAPRRSIRARRGAVVDDAAVVRPRESPSMAEQIFRLALVGTISVRLGKYS